jgi:nitronate monooxygenase
LEVAVILDSCPVPIVLAPLAGGPATPELTAAVTNAGGLGFLAAGYLTAAELAARRTATEQLTSGPFGINVFVPGPPRSPASLPRFAEAIEADARSVGAPVGEAAYEDDDWAAKIGRLLEDPPPVISFTFGFPEGQLVQQLRDRGSEVWMTVTSVPEAASAAGLGADLLVVQGAEAGGHRGGLDDDPGQAVGLLALLQLIRARVQIPLVATGGIATGAGIAAVLAAGARAAALGTAFLGCPEAGTSAVHRAALDGDTQTGYTRAFTGRTARGIRNRFFDQHSAGAPAAYPQVHHLTAPMRKAGRESGRPDVVNLWAGQAYPLTRQLPARDLVRALSAEARDALDQAGTLLPGPGSDLPGNQES